MNLAETTAELAELTHQLGVHPEQLPAFKAKLKSLELIGAITEKEAILVNAALGALSVIMACHHGATGKSEVPGV